MEPGEKTLICPICMTKANRWMVQCDSCDKWYHQSCVGLNEKMARALPEWFCKDCERIKANKEPTESFMFPPSIPSSTMLEGDETVVHNSMHDTMSKTVVPRMMTRVRSDTEHVERSRGAIPKKKSSSASISFKDAEEMMRRLDKEKESIQRDIDETMARLAAIETRSTSKKIHETSVPVRKRKSEGLPKFKTTNHGTTRNDMTQQELLKLQLIEIQAQLSRLEVKKEDPHGANFRGMNTHEFIKPGELSNALNMSHWMARQTVGPLPRYDGKPGTWPGFHKTLIRTTEMCGFTNDENQERLRASLAGPALEMVESYLGTPNALPTIMRTLEQVFGRPEQTLHAILSKIRNEPPPKTDKPETFVRFAMAVRNVWTTMDETNMKIHMNNPQVLQDLIDKLPLSMRFQWASHIIEMEEYDVATFANWLDKIIHKTMLVVPNMDLYSVFEEKSEKKRTVKSREHTYAHEMKSEDVNACGYCDGDCPLLSDCKKFQGASYDEKWRVIRKLGVCKQCLRRHPIRSGLCKDLVKCTEQNCRGRHHPAMHPRYPEENEVFNGTHMMGTSRPQFRYLPITLGNGNIRMNVYAFMDEGSSGTLIEEDLAKCLKLTGSQTTLHVNYTADCSHTESSLLIESIDVSGRYEGAKTYELKNVQTVKKLGLATQTLDYAEEATRYTYLRGLPIESYDDVRPAILIGLNNWNCAVPTKIRFSSSKEPIAARCALGWTVFAGNPDLKNQHVNYHVIEEEPQSLHERLKKWISIDSLGVAVPRNDLASREDRRAIDLLNRNTRKVQGRYETSLLWKHEEIVLPDSSQMALQRMRCLEARMRKDPDFGKAVRGQMQEWMELGYVRKLTQKELSMPRKTIWYLPLFAVFNANKPGKTRLVLDAKAAVDGTSLNSVLLKGPDNNSNLLQVLLRFRQRRVGITADIRHMFQQVRIREDDQHAQRLFWRDSFDQDPEVFVVQVMTFGATCSPATAQYVKNLNASKYGTEYPRAVRAIIDNHYVDDLLDSMDDPVEAIAVARQVSKIHRQAGFEIGKWKSNSPEVMKTLGGDDSIEQKNMNFEQEQEAEKVLGMWWRMNDDCFTYSLRFNKGNSEVLNGERAPTKVEMLRVLMSVYDPMGLIAHFLARLKAILRETVRLGKSWNDVIDGEILLTWYKWLRILPQVEDLRIPRCYLSSFMDYNDVTTQLHVFVDASDECSAAVAYFRMQRGREVHCSIVSAKTKVAPIKLTSIPRLELAAALMGARLANSICQTIDLEVRNVVFWSDSTTVLGWLRTDTRNISGQYVAFRVSEIQDTTDVSDWRYVPSRMNPADDATKWSGVTNLRDDCRWFEGPDFLYEPEEQWPKDVSKGREVKEEIRQVEVMTHYVSTSVIQYHRFSTWNRLLRTIAYVFRYLRNLQAKTHSCKGEVGILTQEELKMAELTILQRMQSEEYPSEFKTLSQIQLESRPIVNKKSDIYTLSPVMVEGLIRCKGRASNLTEDDKIRMEVSDDTLQPIILPPKHWGTRLLIRFYHEKFHHVQRETVVNEIRKKYYVPRLRQLCKEIQKECSRCVLLRAKPKAPEMGELPRARLQSFTRPFSFVGVDCLGPIEVSVGRRREKRWIALFTCLTTRAVHLEILHGMDHDTFILAFRNFIQDRGYPQEVYSDNGTNFVKSERILREEWERMDKSSIAKEFVSPSLKWLFNPPACPHMGGSWERLVKSVKQAFYSMDLSRKMNDPLLYSLMKEIQNMINSRPLTYIPLDHENSEALTPNHFLKGDVSGGHPIGRFSDDAKLLKWNWQMSQLYARHFWKRWTVEYLPELTRRSKWHSPVEPLKPGDLVLIVEPEFTRNCWQKGVIVEVYKGKDEQVRSAKIRTPTGFLTRPAVRLALLDLGKVDVHTEPETRHRGENVEKANRVKRHRHDKTSKSERDNSR